MVTEAGERIPCGRTGDEQGLDIGRMEVKVVTVKAGRMSLRSLDFGCDLLLDFLLSILLDVLLDILFNVLLGVLLDILFHVLLDVLLLCRLNLLDFLALNDDLRLPVMVLLLVKPNGSPPVLKELDVALRSRNRRYP